MKSLISILALAFLVACSKEPMPQNSFETSFTLNSAKEIYHAHITELTIPGLFLSSSNTKSSDLLSEM